MEAGIVAGFQQVTEFVNHHMLDAPLRQQNRKSAAAYAQMAVPTILQSCTP